MRLTLVAAAILVAGLIAAPLSVEAQSSYDYSGFVCANHDYGDCEGHGLAGAELLLEKDGVLGVGDVEKSATADDGGHFYFDGLSEGEYTLTISRAGFEAYEASVSISSSLKENHILQGMSVEQAGTVIGEGPVARASVYFYGDDYYKGQTNDDGEFLMQITAGYYQVEVQHESYRQYYSYQLLDGSDIQVDLESVPGRDILLSGTITDQDGSPVAGAQVNLDQCCDYHYHEAYASADYDEGYEHGYAEEDIAYYDPYYGNYQYTETDESGAFSFYVYEGYYSINAWKDGYARGWFEGEADGDTETTSLVMEKFPDKTAVIKGQVTDTNGKGLGPVSISVSNEKYGQYECSTTEADYEPDYEWGCKIIVNSDGTFEGTVMPGYSIIHVYFDHWRSCTESHNGDGSYSRNCGPDYYQVSRVADLQPDSETEFKFQLQQRPGADAVVQGYILNDEGETVADGQINFNRVDGYGYAWAEMNQYGSYSLALQSGYYSVSVYADGYFRWEGNLMIAADSTTDFDVVLTEGQSSYGYCCYAYAEDAALDYADTAESRPTASGESHASDGDDSIGDFNEGSNSGSGSEDFENLGGLGPYNKEERTKALETSEDTPGLGAFAAAMALVGIAFIARRKL